MTTIQSPIAQEFDASTEVIWFNSAFLIAVTSMTPISGKLCQIFTPRVFLLASITIQSLGTLLTSQARSTRVFLLGRTVCGIGSAAITPVAFILVATLAPPKRRGIFFGLVNTGYTTGIACGAIVAGALEPLLGWRAVFWLQIPVTLTPAIVAFLVIPKERKDGAEVSLAQRLARMDYFGVFTLATTLILLLYSLSAPQIDLWALALSACMLVLFIFVEFWWATDPIVPPSIMRSRANLLTGISTVGVMTARWSILFFIPVYGIAVRGWTQSAAGALLVPTNVGFAVGGLLAGWFHIRRAGPFYTPALVCIGLFAAVQFLVSQLATVASPLWLFTLSLFLNGFLVGGILNYSVAHLLHLTLPSHHFIVLPFNATFRSFSGSFGSAIAGGYFLRALKRNLRTNFDSVGMHQNDELIRKLVGAPMLVQKLEGLEHAVAVESYAAAIRATFLGGVGLAMAMFLVQTGVGRSAPPAEGDKIPPHTREDLQQTLSQEMVSS